MPLIFMAFYHLQENFPVSQPGSSTLTHKKKIVGLIGARNEENIIKQCLQALALYTDAIVFLDDASQDSTLDIVRSLKDEYNIATIITKKKWVRDEPGDRNKLLQAGRALGGTHFVIVDADEMFSANLTHNNCLRNTILQLEPGGCIMLDLADLWNGTTHYLSDTRKIVSIFCDDGTCSYSSRYIHTPRVPNNLAGMKKVKKISRKGNFNYEGYLSDHLVRLTSKYALLHFNYANLKNAYIRKAWYKCLEHINEPRLATAILNQRYALPKQKNDTLSQCPQEWFDGYPFFDAIAYQQPEVWKVKQIAGWLQHHGHDYFANLDIWDINWLIHNT